MAEKDEQGTKPPKTSGRNKSFLLAMDPHHVSLYLAFTCVVFAIVSLLQLGVILPLLNYHFDEIKTYFVVSLLFNLAIQVCFLVGVNKRRRSLLLPWLISNGIVLAALGVGILVGLVSSFFLSVTPAVVIVFGWLCILSVYCFQAFTYSIVVKNFQRLGVDQAQSNYNRLHNLEDFV